MKRLEEAAVQNKEEISNIEERDKNNSGIRSELDQLKHRLEMTDIELQKTNATLRRLGDEMRFYSQEKSKQKEEELKAEVERIQSEIKLLQKTSEDSATVSDKLNRFSETFKYKLHIYFSRTLNCLLKSQLLKFNITKN